MSPRQELALASVQGWIDSLKYWGELVCSYDQPTIVDPVRDVEMYGEGVARACAMLDELFAILEGA